MFSGIYADFFKWQAGLTNGASCGEIIGLFINGYVSERFGYRRTVIACLVLIAGFIAIFFTAPNVNALLAGEILAGIPWGVFQTLTVTYASEVCPAVLRGYLTTYVNACWGIGQLIGIGVVKAMLPRQDQWAYRIPYSLQWMWPLPLIVGVLFAPESPWWLVRRGRIEDAKRALGRLTSKDSHPQFRVDDTVAMMEHTTALERKITDGASYLDCFRGTNRRRTEIVCMCWAMENLAGNIFSNYSTYFLEQAGLTQQDSYSFALGQYAINTIGVLGAWIMMTSGIGRRTLYIAGLVGLDISLLIMGFIGLVPSSHIKERGLATGAMMMVWALIYQFTVGTVTYSLVSEMSTRRLQIKTVVLGRNSYNIAAIASNVLTPYMVNPSAWDWQNFTGFFWAGLCFLGLIYAYFRIPEPSGRTFAELDLLFERKISARKFASTEINPFGEDIIGEVDSYGREKETEQKSKFDDNA